MWPLLLVNGEGAGALEIINQVHSWSSDILFLFIITRKAAFWCLVFDHQLDCAPVASSAMYDIFFTPLSRERSWSLLMMMKDTCRKQSAPLHQEQSQYLGHCRGSELFISIPLLSSECARLSHKALWQKLAHHRLILVVAEPERGGRRIKPL